jgi:hypothetical protein
MHAYRSETPRGESTTWAGPGGTPDSRASWWIRTLEGTASMAPRPLGTIPLKPSRNTVASGSSLDKTEASSMRPPPDMTRGQPGGWLPSEVEITRGGPGFDWLPARGEAGADLNTGRGGVPDSMIRDKPDRGKGSRLHVNANAQTCKNCSIQYYRAGSARAVPAPPRGCRARFRQP